MAGHAARTLAIGAAALAGALAVAISQAPAALAAAALRSSSAGHVDLADPTGTLWRGEAGVVLGAGGSSAASGTRLPGRVDWRLDPWRLLFGTVDLVLHDGAVLDQPLVLHLDRSTGATVGPDQVRLPAAVLQALGAPWNTIKPGGELQLEWDTLHFQSGTVRGGLRAEWVGASSSLSPVVPFGHYRLRADGFFDGATLQLETISGPMEMLGSGTIAGGRHLRFQGTARVQPGTDAAVAAQLSGLIALLGRRDGDGALLDFGT